MRTSKLHLVVTVTGTLFGASLAACGGSDPDPAPTPTTASTSQPSTPSPDQSAKDGGTWTDHTPPAQNTGSGAQSW